MNPFRKEDVCGEYEKPTLRNGALLKGEVLGVFRVAAGEVFEMRKFS